MQEPLQGWGAPLPPPHLPPTLHGPSEELFLPEFSMVWCHHQMLPSGALGQHPQTSTVLEQCQIIHLHITGKALIIYALLHHLIYIDLSWLWGQIRENGSLPARFPRLCMQAREESTQGSQATGTLHRKCRRNKRLK